MARSLAGGVMNYEEAQKVLARAREGFPGTEAEINTALAHTGDV